MNSSSLTVFFDDGSRPTQRIGRCQAVADRFRLEIECTDPQTLGYINPTGEPLHAALISDSLPDSWGRTVVKALLKARSRRDEVRCADLNDAVLLRCICDTERMGALRFSESSHAPHYLGVRHFPLPSENDLVELDEMARRIEQGDTPSASSLERFAENTAALGGSRPKASFRSADNRLCVAKFPSENDNQDKGAWEYCLTKLAGRCGIRTPSCRLIDVGDPRGRIFASVRFDRIDNDRRLHYLSVRCLLGTDEKREVGSYRDLTALIEKICPNPTLEKEELWRRTVFKCMVHDGDDHLRNLGFLLTDKGWQLAPAFDLNASLSRTHFTLSYGNGCRDINPEHLIEASSDWGLSSSRARQIFSEVSCVVAEWSDAALSLGIDRNEIKEMRPAFFESFKTI